VRALRRQLSRLDRAVDEAYVRLTNLLGRRASGRAVVLWVAVLYGGVGLALPLAIGATVLWLVSLNILGATLAFGVVMEYFLGLVQARDRRHLVEWTTDLRLLDSEEFEWFVGEVFRREGWGVELTGRRDGPDGGVDLRLTRGPERRLAQCKRWQSWLVGVDEVRAFGGTLMREGLRGADGVFVTLAGFTPQAEAEARTLSVELVDRADLYLRAEAVRKPELCDECQSPMILGRSGYGWWFRCVKPGCGGKRDLSGEPGRAVELLTEPR
jgi:Restriction endonuclease